MLTPEKIQTIEGRLFAMEFATAQALSIIVGRIQRKDRRRFMGDLASIVEARAKTFPPVIAESVEDTYQRITSVVLDTCDAFDQDKPKLPQLYGRRFTERLVALARWLFLGREG